MNLEEKIVKLTSLWYEYVNLDHHKTKDCYWYIEKFYAFGEPAKYRAYHNGYILNSWTSPDCETEEDAMMWLCNKLENEVGFAAKHLKGMDSEMADYLGKTEEQLSAIIDRLEARL